MTYLKNFNEAPFFEKRNKKKRFRDFAISHNSYDFNSMAIVKQRSGSIKGIKYDDLIDISYSYNADFFNHMKTLECPSFYNRINPMWTLPLSMKEIESILKKFFRFIVLFDENGYYFYENKSAPEYKDDHGIGFLESSYELTKENIETIVEYFDSNYSNEKLAFYQPEAEALEHSFITVNDAFNEISSFPYFAEKLLLRYCRNDSKFLKYISFNLEKNTFQEEGSQSREISRVVNEMRNCFDEFYRNNRS